VKGFRFEGRIRASYAGSFILSQVRRSQCECVGDVDQPRNETCQSASMIKVPEVVRY
jgi:hypothetical protein